MKMAKVLLIFLVAMILVSVPVQVHLSAATASIEWSRASAYNPDLNGDEEISWWEAIVFWLDWCLNGDDIPE